MPHYFGIKRPCLEQNYYEQFNRESVDVIDISKNGIKEFNETGITLEDGSHYEFDVIAIATGFVSGCSARERFLLLIVCCKDITTGGMTQMGLKSIEATELESEWRAAANTYLGLTVSGYPNMFHMVSTLVGGLLLPVLNTCSAAIIGICRRQIMPLPPDIPSTNSLPCTSFGILGIGS